MPYVIDASVVLKWFIPERDSDKALYFLEELRLGNTILLAPDLLIAEIGNALWKRSKVRRELTQAEAVRIFDSFLELPLTFSRDRRLAVQAFQIAAAAGQTMYDSLYIALALKHTCELITADERLVSTGGSTYPFIQRLSAL